MCKGTFFVIAILCLILSCRSPQEKISRLWLYTHYSSEMESKKSSFAPTSFLQLRPDGSFTKYFGVFESGRWELQSEKLILVPEKKASLSYRAITNGDDLQLTIENGDVLYFESSPLTIEEETENPFSVNNNQWRIKAANKENDSQLIARLVNHFQYWEAYFTWAYSNNFRTVDVRSVPTPIKIYANGFTVKSSSQLPRTWIDLFFDEQDCIHANEILKSEIKTKPLAWPHTDNRFKMFIGVFQQLQNNLKERTPMKSKY